MILKDIVSFLRGVTLTRFRGWRAGFALLASLLVSGCASLGVSTPAAVGGELSPDVVAQPVEQPPAEVPAPDAKPLADGLDAPQDEELVDVYPGSGRLFDARRAAQLSGVDLATGDIILNFENADIKEVVHFILGQQLGENYVIHPGLAGTVTLQTSRPLPREALLPTLESLLRINGATLIVGENGVYQVRPREGALRGTSVPRTVPGGPGMGVRIVPLVFIGALEMAKILEPFLTTGALLRVDPVRNLLLLAGSRSELDQWQETIDIFDVDWLAGMSVGVFTLRHAKVGEVVSELERLTDVNNGGPLAGLLQFLPIERINALLVMTSQPRYLEDAKEWVRRLDRAKDVQRTRLHVYRMQHAKAEDVAGLLSQIYGGKETGGASTAAPALAPGLEPAQIGSGNLQSSEGGETTPVATSFGGGEDEVGQLEAGVRIYADNSNNS